MPMSTRFTYLIGAAGVALAENRSAKRFGVLLEVPMLMAALWILFGWWGSGSQQPDPVNNYYDLSLWGLFAVETVHATFAAIG